MDTRAVGRDPSEAVFGAVMDGGRAAGRGPGWALDGTGPGSGEVVLALLAPADDLDPGWLEQVRLPGQAVRIVVAYEPPLGAFPYVARGEHEGFDEGARALVMLDRAARALPADDASDASSWCAVGPIELEEELRRVGRTAARVVVSWPWRRGWARWVLRLRARGLARRLARDLDRPIHLLTLGGSTARR